MASPGVDFTRPLLFRETADDVVFRRKIVTRRVARMRDGKYGAPPWRVGALAKCYQRSPRAGGQPFAVARIESCELEPLGKVSPSDCVNEGFPDLHPDRFMLKFAEINQFGGSLEDLAVVMVWRVQFTLDVKL